MTYNGSDKHKIALFENKQDKLTAGDNISLTPQQDGTVRIDASGGSGTVTDVEVDGTSVVDENGVAEIPAIPSDIDDLSDVQVSSPSNGDVLKYNSNTNKWVNGEAGGGNVDDVNVNGVSVVDANKVAQVFTHKEVTRAQYDALPDSKYSDGIIYCIKDSGSANDSFFSPIIYSLAEREVGVWTDGKPLYEKTFDFTLVNNTSAGEANYPHNIQNVDKIFVATVSSGCNSPRPTAGSMYEIGVFCGQTVIRVETGKDRHTERIVVTLRYTKTTDNPGTGKWATNGVPAHHYSTDEQVIGTWIDGSTLYEKTITGLSKSVAPRVWTNLSFVELGVSNIEMLVDCKAYTSTGLYFTLGEFCAYPASTVIQIQSVLDTRTLDTLIIQYTKSS